MMDKLVLFYYIIYVITCFINLKSYILGKDEKKIVFSFYFILYFHFMIYDLLIVRKKKMSIYVLEKNIPIRVDSHTYL